MRVPDLPTRPPLEGAHDIDCDANCEYCAWLRALPGHPPGCGCFWHVRECARECGRDWAVPVGKPCQWCGLRVGRREVCKGS